MFGRSREFLRINAKKLGLGAAAMIPLSCSISTAVAGDIHAAHPPHYHWIYEDWNRSHDVNALRRGYQVYKEVCSSCHCLRYMCYRHLVGNVFTQREAKAEAKAAMIEDGPDENGDLFLRPGTLEDNLPPPYNNDMAARAANGGALPPDLSLMVGARRGGPNYLFSLLTGYCEEIPPGVSVGPGQAYNPFFEGGVIGMPPPLQDGAVEYPDGTQATVSQMAKDVTEFLAWSYWRTMDTQKQIAMVSCVYTWTAALFWFWAKRFVLAHVWTQKLTYKNVRPWKMA